MLLKFVKSYVDYEHMYNINFCCYFVGPKNL